MTDVTFRELSDLLKSLNFLDRDDVPFLSNAQWPGFRDDPKGFFVRANDATQRALFEAVEAQRERA